MIFKKISKKFFKKYPGLRFLREYSPKTYDRKEILRKIMNFISECNVDGDYLEFGVYKGSTFIEAIKTAQKKRLDSMRFYAFDSFQGLPDPKGIDKSFDQFSKNQVANSLDNFRNTIKNNKLDFNKIGIVSGWFKDTLNNQTKNKLKLSSAAVVWIDCDLYESTLPVFDFITDLVVDGTVIILDDWFFYRGRPDMGEQKAFSEWLKKHPEFSVAEFHKYSWHGNSFILHKNK